MCVRSEGTHRTGERARGRPGLSGGDFLTQTGSPVSCLGAAPSALTCGDEWGAGLGEPGPGDRKRLPMRDFSASEEIRRLLAGVLRVSRTVGCWAASLPSAGAMTLPPPPSCQRYNDQKCLQTLSALGACGGDRGEARSPVGEEEQRQSPSG